MPIEGFKQRVVTAILFGIVVLGMIFIHPVSCHALFFIIGLWVTFEYSTAVKTKFKYFNLILFTGTYILIHLIDVSAYEMYLLWACLAMTMVLGFFVFKKRNHLTHEYWSPIVTLLYLSIPLGLLSIYIREIESYRFFILSIVVLIWLSDSGAYIVGSRVGKRKLIPRISPNKTVEGFLGSLLAALIGAFILAKINNMRTSEWWIIVAIIVWIMGSLGDLVQSSIKRKYGVKDTGTILPGHGGLWDRFDSMIMVTPYILFIDKYLF